jgi:phosphohistidine phosphatase
MKRLIILRHAKTERDNPGGDHARNLTKRGERNATEMGKRIHEIAGVPDAIVTSDARRALQTAMLASEAMGFQGSLIEEPVVYHAPVHTLVEVVQNFPDDATSVVLVGHNPAIFELGRHLTKDASIDELPTAGVLDISFPVDQWRDVKHDHGVLNGKYVPSERD